MQFPIMIGLRRSRFLDGAIALVLVVVGFAAWFFPGGLAIRLTILGFGVAIATLAWHQIKPTIKALRLERNGDFSVQQTAGKDFLPAEILLGASVHPWLTVLRLKVADQAVFPLIVAVDGINASDFRRLRVFLRWRLQSAESASPED